ncbi:MAG TPA: tetratricopeptide repeat protein [Bacteroidales bacterium]|jgi:Tfp pilus assembly protein PilF|nr:tetratricopeptide repeat protein [Bacteroidales bacterium]HQA85961.1 tetratricopeptide repeat protein [Bacteroidales bacterium]
MLRRFCFYLTIFILILGCNTKKENNYASLPKELAELSQKIDKSPKDAELYYLRAQYYYEHKEIDKAQVDILKSIALAPEVAKYYISLSDIYFAQRKTDDTEEMLQKAIRLEPENNEARLKLAELYFHLKMVEDCNRELDAALQKQNHNPQVHLIRAFLLKQQGDTTGAIRMLQLTIDQDPKEVKAFLELGYIFQKRNDPLAISYYQNALLVDPKNSEIRYNLALMFQELGEIEKAKEEYKQLLTFEPQHLKALHNIGYIDLVYEQNFEEAVAFFTKAIELNPEFFQAICNRGIAFEKLEQYDNARQDYMYSLKLKENFEPAIDGLNRLDKIEKRRK